jgi:hypothetical protein
VIQAVRHHARRQEAAADATYPGLDRWHETGPHFLPATPGWATDLHVRARKQSPQGAQLADIGQAAGPIV